MVKIQRKISKFNHYKKNNPEYIVLHYVGAQSSTAKNNVDYFAGGNRGASAHYFVDDNSIWQSVENHHGAWHVGNTETNVNNYNSIGVEMCCMKPGLMVSEETEQNTLELIDYLMKKFDIPLYKVVTHHYVSGGKKICPNWNDNDWSRLKAFIKKLENINFDKDSLYRVKTVANKQLGAFSVLNNAVNLAKEESAIVYNDNNEIVKNFSENIVNKSGTGTIMVDALKVRNKPSTAEKHVATYYQFQKVNFYQILTVNNYIWLRYTSYTGEDRYIPAMDIRTGKKFINY